MRLRRDLFNTVNNSSPNFIWSVGNESDITNLTDFMIIYNNGITEFENEVIINADMTIFGHRYSANGIEPDKSAYTIELD